MWLNLLSMGVKTASHLYKNKQRTKMLMSDAQSMHAEKMARGEIEYKAKVIESNDKGWKDEFVLVLLSIPILVLAWAVFSDNPQAMDKVNIFFEHFAALPKWFTSLWILVVASIFGIKGTQIFRGGGSNNKDKK